MIEDKTLLQNKTIETIWTFYKSTSVSKHILILRKKALQYGYIWSVLF